MSINCNIFILVGIYFLTTFARTDITLNHNNTSLNNCYNGAYQVKDLPFDACSGFRYCEKGYYCQNGIKYLCPSGYYGDSIGLTSSNCTGKCSSGFYCLEGSTISTSNFCGDPSKYCPIGSSIPLIAPPGYYTLDVNGNDHQDSLSSRSSIKICPIGHYCKDGIKLPCLPGYYGDSYGLSQETCTDICPEGWYCPPATGNPFEYPCGNTPKTFCPKGSWHKLMTQDGYYAISSHINIGGGYGETIICPRGSYCSNGIRYLCPAGRYGSELRETNTSCAGVCTAGFYCPEGSITNKEKQCPSAAVYCPTESAAPIPVTTGYYSIGHSMLDFTIAVDYTYDGGIAGDMQVASTPFHDLARVTQTICEPGYYCLSDGIKRMCPPGRYGSTYGLSTPSCSGYCSAGYYCPEGSQSFTQYKCGDPSKFCPPGSPKPQIANIGYYTVLGEDITTRAAERRCEPGYFCQIGIKALCHPGFWGGTFGLITPTCSGLCTAGYYCPEGSISATEKCCGDANKYCPEGSYLPIIVSSGYYSVGGNDSTRYNQVIAPPGHYAFNGLLYVCPAGFYGAISGLSDSSCSGPCNIPGYYCPTGSTSPVMRYCGGDNVFCPPYTVAPIQVHVGFYTADYLYEKCPPGMWRSLAFDNITNAKEVPPIIKVSPLDDCQLCPEGTYKHIAGDDINLCIPCGRPEITSSIDRITCECNSIVPIAKDQIEGYIYFFNVTTSQCIKINLEHDLYLIDSSAWNSGNALTRFQQFPCTPGHYCLHGLQYKCPHGRYGALTQEIRSLCEGICSKGYFCLESSTSPMSYPCGNAQYICPEGSFIPTLVPPGYYSNEEVPETLRYSQNICPLGYYCPGDGRRYPCSPGTFTDQEGTILSTCMGVCDRGHYCITASPSRIQFKCGNSTVYCPRGSYQPTLVNDGFYGIFTGTDGGEQQLWDINNSTLSAELPCEPGYYCKAGIKQPCPPGSFGYRYGLVESTCSGLCAAGYYCPSILEPQPDAAVYTIWPRKPQITATAYECGDVRYYCPKGTKYPLIVGGGNYSIGGSSHNRTRVDQVICSPGSYCLNAISILCPPGRYGNTMGLSDKSCTATCPAGYYCPSGTVNPYPCQPTEYSTGSVSYCSKCPGNRINPLLCQYEKGCCFRG